MQENKKNKLPIIAIAISLLMLGGIFGIGYLAGTQNNSDPATDTSSNLFLTKDIEKDNVDFETFWLVWDIINSKYVTHEMPSNETKMNQAVAGLVSSLNDPYSLFLPKVESEKFSEGVTGEFQGVGMEIGIRDEVLVVIAPLKDTPAFNAGIKSGDFVIAIDDKSTFGLSIQESVDLIRGEKGTSVKLTIVREGEDQVLEIDVVRDLIKVPAMETEIRDDGIYVVELSMFSPNAVELFDIAMRELRTTGGDKLIIDLRNNPGGYLNSSVDIASYFLPAGKIVVRESYGSSSPELTFRTRQVIDFETFSNKDLELVILINEGSASASEILAGALREHNEVVLIGMQSFGKGSVQELIPLPNEASLKLTVARWLTPNGISISEEGLTPDIEIDITKEDYEELRDPQLEKAVEYLLSDEKTALLDNEKEEHESYFTRKDTQSGE